VHCDIVQDAMCIERCRTDTKMCLPSKRHPVSKRLPLLKRSKKLIIRNFHAPSTIKLNSNLNDQLCDVSVSDKCFNERSQEDLLSNLKTFPRTSNNCGTPQETRQSQQIDSALVSANMSVDRGSDQNVRTLPVSHLSYYTVYNPGETKLVFKPVKSTWLSAFENFIKSSVSDVAGTK